MISVRKCFSDDLTLLAEYNKRLIEDEKSDNPMDPAQLRGRLITRLICLNPTGSRSDTHS